MRSVTVSITLTVTLNYMAKSCSSIVALYIYYIYTLTHKKKFFDSLVLLGLFCFWGEGGGGGGAGRCGVVLAWLCIPCCRFPIANPPQVGLPTVSVPPPPPALRVRSACCLCPLSPYSAPSATVFTLHASLSSLPPPPSSPPIYIYIYINQ